MNDHLISMGENNLSGRSRSLQAKALENGVYISPQLNDSLSGLSVNVQDELALNVHFDKHKLSVLLEDFAFDKSLLSSSPQELSGGEKAKLSLITAILQKPDVVCVDSTFEQIESMSRVQLIKSLQKYVHQVYISDNSNEIESIVTDKADCKVAVNTDLMLNINDVEHENFQLTPVQMSPIQMSPNGSSPTITVNNLCFSYGNERGFLFDNFSFELDPSTIHEFKGKNGSGKSTLAKILLGLINTKESNIKINGAKVNMYQKIGQLFSYHFQNPDAQLFTNSVLEELSNDSSHISLTELAATFGLANVLEENPFDLPLAIRKRLALAASLSLDRPWYILDEPTLFQDTKTIQEIAKIVLRLKDAGKGVIIITHNTYFRSLLKPKELYMQGEYSCEG